MYAGVPITEPAAVWKPTSSSSRLTQLRDAEVEQLDELGAVGGRHDDHVVGLEIAVDDADRVRGAEAVADLHEHGERARQIDAGARPLAEALPAQELHDDERRAVVELDEVGDVDDVAVADAVDRAALPGRTAATASRRFA